VSFPLTKESEMKRKMKKEKVILEFYLSILSSQITEGEHVDQDTLAALLDGNITKREATNLTKHLTNCGFCRHLVAELIKFDSTLIDSEEITYQSEQNKISDAIRNLLNSIFQQGNVAIEAFEDKTESENLSEESIKKEDK
jgi:hypothetical protein